MSDFRQSSSAAPGFRLGPMDPPPIDPTLWTLARGASQATARMPLHPRGVALVVAVDGHVQLTQVFQARRTDDVLALADSVRRRYEADGWANATGDDATHSA